MPSTETLRALLKKDMDRIYDDSKAHKRLYRRVQVAVILLSALTAIVGASGLVLPDGWENGSQFAVVVLAAATTAITSYGELRRARELWQHEREVYYALKDLERELELVESLRTLSADEITAYFGRHNEILGASVTRWSQIVKPQPSPTPASSP